MRRSVATELNQAKRWSQRERRSVTAESSNDGSLGDIEQIGGQRSPLQLNGARARWDSGSGPAVVRPASRPKLHWDWRSWARPAARRFPASDPRVVLRAAVRSPVERIAASPSAPRVPSAMLDIPPARRLRPCPSYCNGRDRKADRKRL